jgi:hypothetical protein
MAGFINGALDLPNAPTFGGLVTSDILNVTGNGTAYKIVYDTELWDNGNDFDGTSFTVPITGVYLFTFSCALKALTASASNTRFYILSDVNLRLVEDLSDGGTNNAGGSLYKSLSTITSLTAGDVVDTFVSVTGMGSDVIDITSGSAIRRTAFSGYLITKL